MEIIVIKSVSLTEIVVFSYEYFLTKIFHKLKMFLSAKIELVCYELKIVEE